MTLGMALVEVDDYDAYFDVDLLLVLVEKMSGLRNRVVLVLVAKSAVSNRTNRSH